MVPIIIAILSIEDTMRPKNKPWISYQLIVGRIYVCFLLFMLMIV